MNLAQFGATSALAPTTQTPEASTSLYQQFGQNVKNGTVMASSQPSPTQSIVQKFGNTAKNVGSDYMDMTKNLGSDLGTINKGTQTMTSATGGNLNPFSKGFYSNMGKQVQGLGQVGSGILQGAGDVVKGVFSPITEALKPVIQKAANGLENNSTFSNIANSKVGDSVANALDSSSQKYQQWSQANPEKAKNLEAAANTIMGITGEEAEEPITQGIKKTASTLNDAVVDAAVPKGDVGELSKNSTNSLENSKVGEKPGAIDRAKAEIQAGNKPPVKIRTLEDGSQVIEDGRHHLEAAKQLGLKQYPIEDVTAKYAPKTAKITPELARQQAAEQGVKSVGDIKSGIKQGESTLGTNFSQAARKISEGDSSARLNLNNDQIDRLNSLKEGKNFALPDYLEKNSSTVDNGTGKFGNVKLTPKAQAELEAAGKSTNTSLTPDQAQDLIKKLNKSTFKEVGGTLQTDQQRVDLTNEIKNAAQSAFGHVTDENGESVWNKAYQDYAKGKQVTEDLKGLTGLKNSTTPPDKILNKILTHGKTPEGKIMLQNAVDEFKSQTGIDLTDSTKAVHQILDKQLELEEAQNKGKGLKGFEKYLGRTAAGGVIRIGILYPAIRAIMKAVSGK